jgi:hypothetical protein
MQNIQHLATAEWKDHLLIRRIICTASSATIRPTGSSCCYGLKVLQPLIFSTFTHIGPFIAWQITFQRNIAVGWGELLLKL